MEYSINTHSIEDAEDLFILAKDRLLDISDWNDGQTYVLTDGHKQKAHRNAHSGDFIKIEGELATNGCEAAIMACTELSCFKEMYRLPDYYIDAMEVLAAKSIQVCGRKLREKEGAL